jgi:hypothetical protein
MERIPNQQYAELIETAYEYIPSKIMELVKPVHFFTGTDPIFAGLINSNDVPLHRMISFIQ